MRFLSCLARRLTETMLPLREYCITTCILGFTRPIASSSTRSLLSETNDGLEAAGYVGRVFSFVSFRHFCSEQNTWSFLKLLADSISPYRQDAQIGGEATGAMSWAFISALKKNPQQSYVQLLNSIRDELASKYTQKPQLSCSHPLSKLLSMMFGTVHLTDAFSLDTNLLYVM